MAELPDWVHPGAAVIVSRRMLTERTVERVTKTQIVVAGERMRFRVSDLRETGNSDPWRVSARLLNPADPAVRQRLREQRASSLRNIACADIEPLLLRWRREGDDAAAREAQVLIAAALAKIVGASSSAHPIPEKGQ